MDEPISTYLDERDPRKRKRSEDMLREVSSPKSRSSSRMNAADNWAQRAEAFIHKVNDPPPSNETRANPSMGYATYNYGVVGYPNYTHHGGYPPPPPPPPATVNLNASSYNSHYKGSVEVKEDHPSSDPGNNHSSSKALKRKSRREESSTSSSSSDSDEDRGKKISSEQRSKLKIQKEQYEKAQEKLEAQLIKLKEQREALKEGGAKHEDKIMKDNARLQKEVKNRLSHMKEVLDKIVVGLDQSYDDAKNNSRKRETSVQRSKSRNKSSSRERSSEKSKKKKKKRHRGRSVSDDCDDDDDSEKESRKKHKKKKKKYRSSSSSEDSDSEHERKKTKKKAKNDVPLDDSIFRMVSDLKNLKSSKKGDETFMDLLGKMSEAYMKAKQENNELSHRINALESENQLLKKQLEDRAINDPQKKKEDNEKEEPKKWDVKTSHVIEVVEPKRKKKDILEEIKKISKKEEDEDPIQENTSRSVRSKMIEKEENSRNDLKKNGDSGTRKSKERSVSKERDRRSRSRDYSYYRRRDYSPDRRNRYREDNSRRRSSRRSRSRERRYSRSRSKERRSSSRDSRSRSKDYREKSKSREFKSVKDRNDKINLDEWAEKPATEKDPSLMSLKEKMIIKEKESEQQKKQWAAVSEVKSPEAEEPVKEMLEVEQQPLTTSRPQVAIQWGQGIKKGTPEPMQQNKKTQPLVGKMPWLQKGSKKPGESRFGPPTTMSNIPPPGVLSTVPTPFGLLTPEEAPVPPPLPPPKKNPPKNPTPQAMDMNAMLAAAQAHMRARSEEFVSPEMEIPLPPLPAATDKDPDALNDTRPPKVPTPPPVREKTEMEIMIEKHCPGTDVNDYTKNTYADAPKISSKFDLPPGEEDMDPSELAMLGIDPSDLAGFGK